MLCLRDAGIAHGDLQHGNILVNNLEFKLVDYDGMFVPPLSGRDSNEIGHRSYQHPGRTKANFGPYLDNFSAWLIYTCLVCTSVDSDLWWRLAGGDECLLFRQQDLLEPLYSPAFFLLENHPSALVRRLGSWVRWLLSLPVSAVPALDVEPEIVGALQPVNDPAATALPEWVSAGMGSAYEYSGVTASGKPRKKDRGAARKARRLARAGGSVAVPAAIQQRPVRSRLLRQAVAEPVVANTVAGGKLVVANTQTSRPALLKPVQALAAFLQNAACFQWVRRSKLPPWLQQ